MPVIIYPRQGRTDSGNDRRTEPQAAAQKCTEKGVAVVGCVSDTTTEYNLWNGGPLYRQRPGRDLTVLPAGERARLAGWSVNRETEGGRTRSSRSDGRPIWRCPGELPSTTGSSGPSPPSVSHLGGIVRLADWLVLLSGTGRLAGWQAGTFALAQFFKGLAGPAHRAIPAPKPRTASRCETTTAGGRPAEALA